MLVRLTQLLVLCFGDIVTLFGVWYYWYQRTKGTTLIVGSSSSSSSSSTCSSSISVSVSVQNVEVLRAMKI